MLINNIYFYAGVVVICCPNPFHLLIRTSSPNLEEGGGLLNIYAGRGPHVRGQGEEVNNVIKLIPVCVAYDLPRKLLAHMKTFLEVELLGHHEQAPLSVATNIFL